MRDADRVYRAEDMASGDVLFAATGVTDGNLLAGVRFGRQTATTLRSSRARAPARSAGCAPSINGRRSRRRTIECPIDAAAPNQTSPTHVRIRGRPFAPRRYFLGVSRSVTGRAWVAAARCARRGGRDGDGAARARLGESGARAGGARRRTGERAAFLSPSLRQDLPDPSSLTDMERGRRASPTRSSARESVAIFGDYDVDGATSSALLHGVLAALGAPVRIYIPDRIFEGYGPNPEAIDELVDGGATLIVCVDCGSTSFEALQRAKERGVDVIVLDHHQVGAALPPARRHRQPEPAGRSLRARAISRRRRDLSRRRRAAARAAAPRHSAARCPICCRFLDLVALGTVCDMVPLTGLNRAFVGEGAGGAAPYRAARAARADRGLAAEEPARLRPSRLPARAAHQCRRAHRRGGARRAAPHHRRSGRGGADRRPARPAERGAPGDRGGGGGRGDRPRRKPRSARATGRRVLVASRDELASRRGRAGRRAAQGALPPAGLRHRLERRRHRHRLRPLGPRRRYRRGGAGGGRGGILVKGGGHAMAAGVTVERERLGALRAFLEERLGARDPRSGRRTSVLEIDGALSAAARPSRLIEELERAGPFGNGNPAPVFAFPAHRVAFADSVGNGHVRVSLVVRRRRKPQGDRLPRRRPAARPGAARGARQAAACRRHALPRSLGRLGAGRSSASSTRRSRKAA